MSTAAAGSTEIARTPNTSSAAAAPPGSATTGGRGRAAGNPTPKARGRRKDRPAIDLDTTIEQAHQAAKDAAKALTKARAEARAERKRRARLIRKAGQLSPADLERIAVLKRTGWWDPSTGTSHTGASAGKNTEPAAKEGDKEPAAPAACSSDPHGSAASGGAPAIVDEKAMEAPQTPHAGQCARGAPRAPAPEHDAQEEESEEEQEQEDASPAKDDGDGM